MHLNILVKSKTHTRSNAIDPTNGSKYDLVPICECASNRKTNHKEITQNVARSFKKITKALTEKFGPLKTISVFQGEGGFGMVILLETMDGKDAFVVKTQKCISCETNNSHGANFMKEINAIQKIIDDPSYVFLLPYVCAYYPTQREPFWFDDRVGKKILIKENSNKLGLIVMRKMERPLRIRADERDRWTGDSQSKGGWLSFIWSGSLLGILGELIVSNSFHSDLKEDNIVGIRMNKRDPFTFIWKAIDFGGAGTATSESDFLSAMYTPHYGPIQSIHTNQSNSNYAWSHDVVALAHVVRNLVSFMTSTSKKKTPYSSVDNVERFL